MYHRQAYEVDGRHRFWGGLALGVVGGGKTLAAEELRAAGRARIDLVYGAPVSDLDVDEAGAVRGVLLGDGRRCRSRAVVLGSGGFQADPGMRARYLGKAWSKAKVRGTRHNAGDGLRMALAAGAARAGDWASCHSVAWDADAPASGDHELTNRHTKQSYPLGIIVNSAGERFFDEGADFRNYTYARLGAAIIVDKERAAAGLAWCAIAPENMATGKWITHGPGPPGSIPPPAPPEASAGDQPGSAEAGWLASSSAAIPTRHLVAHRGALCV